MVRLYSSTNSSSSSKA
ncbi:hypothetical protein FD725_00520 [Nostoc sp. TCL26-01]|nr:hypothetical protein FD725_00520 [Nostoc sp. TCL26-01]